MPQSIRVLFVYDNEAALAVRSEMLERYSQIEVTTTTDASTALETVSDGGIDCLLSGYALAGSDGIALARAVQQHDPGLPVILFADNLSTARLETAFEAGITDHVPVSGCQSSYDLLVERIRASIRQRSEQVAAR